MNDSNVCLKNMDAHIFHHNLNTINSNIQFTIEHARHDCKGQSIAFLDKWVTAHSDGSLEIDVYRKKTHANKYLESFNSYNPLQHNEGVLVRTGATEQS